MLEAAGASAARCAASTSASRPWTWVPTDSSAAGPRRSSCAARSVWATPWCRSPRAARRCGHAAGCGRCPKGWRWAFPPGSGRRPARASLGLRGRLGLARDALLPRPDVRGPIGDRSVGPLVARKLGPARGRRAGRPPDRRHPRRLGRRHVRRGRVPAAARRGPAPRRPDAGAARRDARPATPTGPPLFWALAGRHGLTGRRVALRSGRGVDIRLGAPGRAPGAGPAAGDGPCARRRHVEAGRVVLATAGSGHGGAAATARWRGGRPARSDRLRLGRRSSRSAPPPTTVLPLARNGLPRASPQPAPGRDAWAVTACTYLDRKWPHLARDGEVLLRASLGSGRATAGRTVDDEEVGSGVGGARPAARGGGRAGGNRGDAVSPALPRSGWTTCSARPGSRRLRPAGRARRRRGGLPRGRRPGLHRQRAGRGAAP